MGKHGVFMKAWIQSILDDLSLKGIRGYLVAVIGVLSSCFFILTAFRGSFDSFIQRGFMLWVCVVLILLTKPFLGKTNTLCSIVDILLILLATAAFGYLMVYRKDIMFRAGLPNMADAVFGLLACVLIVEATRRKLGNVLPILAIVFTLYGIFGKYMPSILKHRGMSLNAFTSVLVMTEDGIFGPPATAAANFIMVFIIFGAFLKISGAGDLFITLATGAFGKTKGGSAKASITGAALMGMISGSCVANVMTTGTLTIPMMKRNGYDAKTAGAINAVAATGGQIMPPVMGSAAFIMADTLRVPYWDVVVAAFVPACLYYLAEFFMVDFEACRLGISRIPQEEMPDVKGAMKKYWYMLLPIIVLVFFLGYLKMSAQKSAFFSIVVILVLCLFRKETFITPKKFISGLIEGALSGLEVGIVCGCAGILIGIILRSGLGLSLTGMLVEISGGKLLTLLVLTMITSIIMGMGLPTSACYIITATLISPAMVKLGVAPMAAHLYAFYFACLSAITPPVALATYAAAGVAGSPPMPTGLVGVKYGLCGFIVPYMFIYGNELLLMGSPFNVIVAIITSCIGTYILAAGLIGHQFSKIAGVIRIVYVAAALLLIIPGFLTDIVGLGIATVLTAFNYTKAKKAIIV